MCMSYIEFRPPLIIAKPQALLKVAPDLAGVAFVASFPTFKARNTACAFLRSKPMSVPMPTTVTS
ncbi:hypothetical protein ACRALDRAFT_1077244, partial [Sodiomyces alcalophilus JCM 7366]|uniref:uncharacterized protein n=1 Tax=Sodiomyces alcalophilus JCM 7366 TaxID=591952 RepID=UPI0039B64DB0